MIHFYCLKSRVTSDQYHATAVTIIAREKATVIIKEISHPKKENRRKRDNDVILLAEYCRRMRKSGESPDKITSVALLKQCNTSLMA